MRAEAKKRREYWVAELAKVSESFGNATSKMIEGLRAEIASDGKAALLDHLRICGAMPEQYAHDSSAEKRYSKYTDAVICEAFASIGLGSTVITARADAADVQASSGGYSLVADAKAFRLSRTAKNQKDFKIQAMDGWRGKLDFATVVCPIYQLPSRTSQIYQQAISRNVCILSYSHLAALVGLGMRAGSLHATKGLGAVLKTVSLLHPSKSASDYWTGINKALIDCLGTNADLWREEKTASLEGLAVVKEESLAFLRMERDRLLGLSHREALDALMRFAGIDSRIAQVNRVTMGALLGE